MAKKTASNRTILELKQTQAKYIESLFTSSNRTILELKQNTSICLPLR